MVNHRIETWPEINKRHTDEKRQLIRYCLAHKMTQTEAAKLLNTSTSNLNKWCHRQNIKWPGSNPAGRKPRPKKKFGIADLRYGEKGTVNK